MHNTTFDYAISFSRDAADVFYPDSTELAKIVMAVIVVLFTAAVSLRYMTGEGTKMYQKTLLTSILFTLIFVQYYQLWFAILKLPTDFISTANRWDCLNSDKGGKVSLEAKGKNYVTSPQFLPLRLRFSLLTDLGAPS